MVSPGKSVRLLNQSGNGVDILFQWQSSLPTDEKLILETSPLGNFSEEVQKYHEKYYKLENFLVCDDTLPDYKLLFQGEKLKNLRT